MNTSDRFEEQEQLDWLAFQYVADELNQSERAAFELRLAEDSDASEAVVAAMKLAQQIDHSLKVASEHTGSTSPMANSADSIQPERPATLHSTRFSTQLAIAASVAALLFGWWAINPPDTKTLDNYSSVAIAWASDFETADSENDSWSDSPADLAAPDGITSSIDLMDDELLLESDDDWLLVALADSENAVSETIE